MQREHEEISNEWAERSSLFPLLILYRKGKEKENAPLRLLFAFIFLFQKLIHSYVDVYWTRLIASLPCHVGYSGKKSVDESHVCAGLGSTLYPVRYIASTVLLYI